MSSLTLSLEKTFVAGEPTVSATVTAAVGIPQAAFVYRTETGVFSHVAGTKDLRVYGTSGGEYYRSTVVTRTFANVQEADEFATLVRGSLRRLVADWDAQGAFEASVNETYTS